MMGASTPRSSWPCLAAFRPHFAYDDDFINTETPKQKIEVAQYHEPTAPPAGIQPKMAECGQNKGDSQRCSGLHHCTLRYASGPMLARVPLIGLPQPAALPRATATRHSSTSTLTELLRTLLKTKELTHRFPACHPPLPPGAGAS